MQVSKLKNILFLWHGFMFDALRRIRRTVISTHEGMHYGMTTQFRKGHSTPLCPQTWPFWMRRYSLTRLIFYLFFNIYYSFTAYFSFVFLYCRFFSFLPSPPPDQWAGRRWALEVTPCALRRRSIRNYVADTERMQRDKTSNATGAEK